MHNYSELHQLFKKAIEQEISEVGTRDPKNLYEPVIYTLNMGGKRIRPILLMMAFELFDADIEQALPAAIAIEMFHNFTLLHDDMMDGSNLRRNNPTIHIKYSNNTAILSGDAMSILSYEYINKCQSDNYRQIFEIFTQTALKICEGQQFDMDFETRNDVTVDEYLKMIGLKTAILIAASLKIGAMMANAPESEADLMYDFGYNLGMAFQLQDDYLDAYGDTTSFGKNIGGDIVANKKTFLMLKAFEMADGGTREKLQKLVSASSFDHVQKIDAVKTIYSNLGVVDIARELMEKYYNKAIDCWERIDVDPEKKNELMLVARNMMKRRT